MRLLHRPEHHSVFGMPAAARFFFEEDNGGNATTGTSPAAPLGSDSLADFTPTEDDPPARASEAPQERVEGEKMPDFKTLGKKPAAPAEPPEGKETPPKAEKPAGGQPAKPAAPAKPVAKPASTPKPPEKPAAPAKPAAKPAAAAPAAKPAAAAAPAPAKEGDAPPVEVPENDDDIDALKPKPGAPTNVIQSFNDIKALMKKERATARQAVSELTRIKTEADTLRESSGKLPPEVEQELDGLRKFNLLFQAEKDPRFQAEYGAKVTASEEGIFKLLEKHGLKPPIIAEIKAAQQKAGGDLEAWERWNDLLNAVGNPLDRQEILDAIKVRRDAVGAKNARLAELGSSKEKFLEAYGQQQQKAEQDYAKGVEAASIPLAAANEWILEQEIPADATDEQRKFIEAENEAVKKRAEQFGENVKATFSRDPQKSAEIALKAVESDYLREQNEGLTKERDKAVARARELETQIAKIKSAGRIAHVEAAPAEKPGKPTEPVTVGGDGSSAIRSFFKGK